ncbi:MAG: hypothetical protein LBB48_10050 [Treponema sp.]|nr:hypothetical protein [Treponema sp.]
MKKILLLKNKARVNLRPQKPSPFRVKDGAAFIPARILRASSIKLKNARLEAAR